MKKCATIIFDNFRKRAILKSARCISCRLQLMLQLVSEILYVDFKTLQCDRTIRDRLRHKTQGFGGSKENQGYDNAA